MRLWRCVELLLLVSATQAPLAAAADESVAPIDSTVIVPHRSLAPRGALWRSALIPGWGQLRLGHPVKAVIFAGAAGGWLSAAFIDASRVGDATSTLERQDRAAQRNTRVLYYVMTASLAGLDAYVDAHLDDFDLDADPFASIGARLTLRF
mgnify:CR=1 FL=1